MQLRTLRTTSQGPDQRVSTLRCHVLFLLLPISSHCPTIASTKTLASKEAIIQAFFLICPIVPEHILFSRCLLSATAWQFAQIHTSQKHIAETNSVRTLMWSSPAPAGRRQAITGDGRTWSKTFPLSRPHFSPISSVCVRLDDLTVTTSSCHPQGPGAAPQQ